MKQFIYIIIIVLFASCGVKALRNNDNNANLKTSTKSFSVIQIRQKIFYQVLDSVLEFERKCSYFNDSLKFAFSLENSVFYFGHYSDFYSDLIYCSESFCYKYKNHLFFTGAIDKHWFEKTDRTICFSYKVNNSPPPPPLELDDDRTIIQIKDNKLITRQKITCGANPKIKLE
jgi:hypothetical protein